MQVRFNATRLPGKALLKLEDKTVMEHAMAALDTVNADIHCILSPEESAAELEQYSRKAGWEFFTGPLYDVLARYVLAARHYGVNRIVRATGDNPLVSAEMATASLLAADRTNAHYTAFQGLPYGSGVEILDTVALEKAYAQAKDTYEREHVSPYLNRHPELFYLDKPDAPPEFYAPEVRITLDTRKDYDYLSRLYASLYTGTPIPLQTVIAWAKENPFDAG